MPETTNRVKTPPVNQATSGETTVNVRAEEFTSLSAYLPKFAPAEARRVDKPWGWELLWTPPDLPYVGKILHIQSGRRLSLQVHEEKTESWLLIRGRARVTWENHLGEPEESELQAGLGYTCERGRKHRLAGITDCDIVEVSTPEVGMTLRLEDDYGRSDETRT
jgi:mannose-6-phosphate isomerase-like protein (cupin superfamily)